MDFDFETAVTMTERRRNEDRLDAVGYLDGRRRNSEFASSAFVKQTGGRQGNMAKRKPLTNDEGEVRELTVADFAQAVPFSELPASLRQTLASRKRERGPQKTPRKK